MTDGCQTLSLRQKKRDEHLPGVLAQNPETGAEFCSCCEEPVLFRDHFPEFRIIGIKIEILMPEILKFLSAAVKGEQIVFAFSEKQAPVACNNFIITGTVFIEAERLSAVYDHLR